MNRIILAALAAGVALLAGCAAAPEMTAPGSAPVEAPRPAPAPAARPPIMDGGIVGTGNQLDCEPRKAKDGSAMPLPPECRGR